MKINGKTVVDTKGGLRQKYLGQRKWIWRILKVTERFFLYLYADALSSSNSV